MHQPGLYIGGSGVYHYLSTIFSPMYLYIGEQRCVYHFRRFFNQLSSSTICRRSYTKCNFTLVCKGVSTSCQRLCTSCKSTLEWSGVLQVCRRVSTIGVYVEVAEKRFYNKRKIAFLIADRWWRTLSREIEAALRSGNLLWSEESWLVPEKQCWLPVEQSSSTLAEMATWNEH